MMTFTKKIVRLRMDKNQNNNKKKIQKVFPQQSGDNNNKKTAIDLSTETDISKSEVKQ